MSINSENSTDQISADSGKNKTHSFLINAETWQWAILLVLCLTLPFIFFYNLNLHPRPWHDEGAALTLAKTLALDGVYAVKNSDGYQTFGPVQSAGPTVIVPIAIVYRIFGVGLVQGRWIGAAFSLLAIIFIFITTYRLYDFLAALISIFLVLSAPMAEYIHYGRQAGANTAGLMFFMISVLALYIGTQNRKIIYYFLCGAALGLAILSKSQYLIFGCGALGIVMLADVFYYRMGAAKWVILSMITAVSISLAWQGWQRFYFGEQVYLVNLEKLRALSSAIYGFYPSRIFTSIKSLFIHGSFYLWGIASWFYQIPVLLRKSTRSLTILYLWSVAIIWLTYILFFASPQSQLEMIGPVILAIFIGHLFSVILRSIIRYIKNKQWLIEEDRAFFTGSLLAVIIFIILMSYHFLNSVHDYALLPANSSIETSQNVDSWVPIDLVDYLNTNIRDDQIIETWERELGILTNHIYHYPDQSLRTEYYRHYLTGLADADQLGLSYLRQVEADYLIVGGYSRFFNVYDQNLDELDFLASFGLYPNIYEVYQVAKP